MIKQLILVFVGGGLGSIFRFLIGKIFSSTQDLPYATFSANIIGCALIGIFLGLGLKNNSFSQYHVLFFATGFCGGLTTFSSFIYENLSFLKSGDLLQMIIYSILSFTIGIIATFSGLYISLKS